MLHTFALVGARDFLICARGCALSLNMVPRVCNIALTLFVFSAPHDTPLQIPLYLLPGTFGISDTRRLPVHLAQVSSPSGVEFDSRLRPSLEGCACARQEAYFWVVARAEGRYHHRRRMDGRPLCWQHSRRCRLAWTLPRRLAARRARHRLRDRVPHWPVRCGNMAARSHSCAWTRDGPGV